MESEEYLSTIWWVHRPSELSTEIEEADDLCGECVTKLVAELQSKHPDHAEDICVDGGYELYRDSESPAMCAKCGAKLSCCVEINGEEVLIDTEESWNAAEAAFDQQDEVPA